MKLVVGICGVGYGHVRRQLCLLPEFLRQGHHIVVIASGVAEQTIQKQLPSVDVVKAPIPWLAGSECGIDFASSAEKHANNTLSMAKQYEVLANVVDRLHGWPDLVITDYEPLSAQLAYCSGCPLVTVDQQSKFLGYKYPDLNGYSRMEERSRLGLLFPRADLRLACSFYHCDAPKDSRYNVKLVPAIVRQEVRQVASRKDVLSGTGPIVVYLSPYGPTPQTIDEIVTILAKIKKQEFLLFLPTAPHLTTHVSVPPNVQVFPFSEDLFVKAISIARAAICTAGHTLLSELMLCAVPAFCIPLPTFDQHICANVIESNCLGMQGRVLTANLVTVFLNRIGEFKDNILARRGIIVDIDGTETIFDKLRQGYLG